MRSGRRTRGYVLVGAGGGGLDHNTGLNTGGSRGGGALDHNTGLITGGSRGT